MNNGKLVSFQKKETQEIENTNLVDGVPKIPVRKIHRCKPEGVILYKQNDKIIAAYSCIIALNNYRYNNVAVSSTLKIYDKNQYNINYLILLLSEIITTQVSIKELHELHDKTRTGANTYIYPGMITRVHGYIRKIIDEKTFVLEYDEEEISVVLLQENSLYKESKFIIDRFVFVIGIIESLEDILLVTALAILV